MPTQQNNFYYMFVALIVFLVVLPLMEELDAMPTALAQPLSITCLLLIGVWSLRETVSAFRVGIGLAALSVFLSAFGFRQQSDAAYLLALGPFAGFLALAIWSALRQIVYSAYMSPNKLVGAVCVYLMLGILWASFYAMNYKLNPMAFAGLPAGEKGNLGIDWVYYSFVTLTTLGYGDILPLSVGAKILAFSEAIVGVFYMATLVAMLVSAYAAEAGRNQ